MIALPLGLRAYKSQRQSIDNNLIRQIQPQRIRCEWASTMVAHQASRRFANLTLTIMRKVQMRVLSAEGQTGLKGNGPLFGLRLGM
jgi:hypothetical protein